MRPSEHIGRSVTVESAVITEIRRALRTPETTAKVIAALDREDIPEADAIDALQQFPQLWEQLFPRRTGPHRHSPSGMLSDVKIA